MGSTHDAPRCHSLCRWQQPRQRGWAGCTQQLGQDGLVPVPVLPTAAEGEAGSRAAALSLPWGADQQRHFGNKPVISGDTNLGRHLWTGISPVPRRCCITLQGHAGTHGAVHTGAGRAACPCFELQPPRLNLGHGCLTAQPSVPPETPWLPPPPPATALAALPSLPMGTEPNSLDVGGP